jgi:hypothetical protein
MTETIVESPEDRVTAIEAVLDNAPSIGVEEALRRFGTSLTKTEQGLMSSLSAEEFERLGELRNKLGPLARRANNNNNNNNTQPSERLE